MSMRSVAINGFGRIGRAVFRIIAERPDSPASRSWRSTTWPTMTSSPISSSTTRSWALSSRRSSQRRGHDCRQARSQDAVCQEIPATLPWKELDIDVVVEATGVFRTREGLQKHIDAGAKRVILTVPADDEIDDTIVLGVNDDQLAARGRDRLQCLVHH